MEAAFGQVFPFSHSEARSRQAAKRKIRIKKFNKKKRKKNAGENRSQRSNGLIYFVAVPKHLKLEGIGACKRFLWAKIPA